MINELDQFDAPFILVLDDYHLIDNGEIHELIGELLLHPPHNFHLVLGARMDPTLPLVTLRAKGMMVEVRIADLRFNREESQSLIEQILEAPVDRAMLIELQEQSEGWVTGLRLAALALIRRVERDALQVNLSPSNRYVSEYLVAEILEKQAAPWADCLLKTSILERFCVELCEDICYQVDSRSGNGSTGSSIAKSDLSGRLFIKWLQASNLFVIPLDDEGRWFRYHHLFQDFLQQQLKRRLRPEEVCQLHAAAGRWFADNEFVEEGLYHLLAAGDHTAAIQLIAEQRYNLMNTTQWPRLERWLSLFPPQVVESSAELWMIKTWMVYQRGQWVELPGCLQNIADLLGQESDQDAANRLAGEISALRSLIAYHRTDAEGTISLARKALEEIPSEFWIARVFARLYLAGSLLMAGDENSAFHALYGAFEEEKVQNKRFKVTLLTVACYIHWLITDLQAMVQAAKQAISLCQETGHHQILRMANYHLGCARYQQNDLAAAEDLFASVTDRPYENYGTAYTHSVCGLGMTYQAQGRDTEAKQIIERGIAFYLETGNTTQLPIIRALQAEVALRQGNLSAASQWAEKLDPVPPLTPVWGFFAPHLTLVKVWLAQDTPASRDKATVLLRQIQEYLENTHNTRFLIDALALKALSADAAGDPSTALEALDNALRLAQPGGLIRPFVDLGDPMRDLLARVWSVGESGDYVGKILSAFPSPQAGGASMSALMEEGQILEALTTRELEVLELLAERLSNKEIAAQLVISAGTVKGHTIRIYDKLGVGDRRQAVEKAVALGILPSP